MATDYQAITLRLPRDVYDRLRGSVAGQSPQPSLNSEIVERLIRSFENEPWELEQRVDHLSERLATLEALIRQAEAAPRPTSRP